MRLSALRLPSVAMPLVDQCVVSAGTFLLNVVLVRSIALGDYGRYALAIGNALLLQTICAALVFYPLSVHAAIADADQRRRLTVSALILAGGLSVPLAAAFTATLLPFVGYDLLFPIFAVLLASQAQEATRRGLLGAGRFSAAVPGDLLSYGGQAVLVFLVARRWTLDLEGALWIRTAVSLAGAGLQLAQMRITGFTPLPLRALGGEFWQIGRWSLSSNLLGIARTLGLPWVLTSMLGASAAGAFQVAFNLVNVANPVIIGVCNVVPQIAARAAPAGRRAAWMACQPAVATGSAVICAFAAALLLDPGRIAVAVYGAQPELVTLANVVRLLAIGTPFNYAASVFFAYLCGVREGHLSLTADVAALVAVWVLLPPLIAVSNLNGAAIALTTSLALRAAVLGLDTARRVRRAGVDRVPPPRGGREKPA